MDKKDLQKILAGLSIAGLLAGVSITPFGCKVQEPTQTEQAPAPSEPEEEAPAPSSCTGKPGAGGTEEEAPGS